MVALGLLLTLVGGRRVVGVSGVVGGLLPPRSGDTAWRLAFLAGLLGGGVLAAIVAPGTLAFPLDRSLPTMAVSGLLVGYGTRLGNGCTSGHGVGGVARLSRRSLVATGIFMAAGAATVYAVEHLIGGP
jgi:hypothetical protein